MLEVANSKSMNSLTQIKRNDGMYTKDSGVIKGGRNQLLTFSVEIAFLVELWGDQNKRQMAG